MDPHNFETLCAQGMIKSLMFSTNVICVKTQQKHGSRPIEHYD